MSRSSNEVAPDLICLTVDVEWAAPQVLADITDLLNERKLHATFFCTHGGINVPTHERALHPNFRRNGDTLQRLRQNAGTAFDGWTDTEVYYYVVQTTHSFCPEAVGVRAHSLLYDSDVLPIYRQAGLEYDSTYFLPMTPRLNPVWKEYGILEMPIYYMDHFDLIHQVTDFRLEKLHLDYPGLKVFDFHPNLVFINASTNAQYLNSKAYYHDADRLLRMRHQGQGVRTLFLELLDFITTRQLPTATLADLNTMWRRTRG
jgi:hypothetical protein